MDRDSSLLNLPIGQPLTDEELAANRRDSTADLLAHPLNGRFYRERSADLPKITVPLLSAANWAHGLHSRGGFEGWAQASSEQKWLEVHGLGHVTEFYTARGLDLQRRFFGHFLKGEDTGWDRQPPAQLNVRHVDGGFEQRAEQEWPLARTEWTRFYLDPGDGSLTTEAPADRRTAQFDALGEGLTFTTEHFAEPTEITGTAAARLVVASSTTDADLFLTVGVLDLEGRDIRFVSALDPARVVAHGWLRASHRALDAERSLPYRPWHPHDRLDPLTPGVAVPLGIEIWPTSVVVPAGYRLAVTVQGRDFEFPGEGPWPRSFGVEMKGHAVFLHDDPDDRPTDLFGGVTTLVSCGDEPSYLLLPVVPQSPTASRACVAARCPNAPELLDGARHIARAGFVSDRTPNLLRTLHRTCFGPYGRGTSVRSPVLRQAGTLSSRARSVIVPFPSCRDRVSTSPGSAENVEA